MTLKLEEAKEYVCNLNLADDEIMVLLKALEALASNVIDGLIEEKSNVLG